jgi:hypothetical protein
MQWAGQHVPVLQVESLESVWQYTYQVVDKLAKYLEWTQQSHEIYSNPYKGLFSAETMQLATLATVHTCLH